MDAERKAAANAFAMELLMPRRPFLRATTGIDLNDDGAVAGVAKTFGVTAPVATARIIALRSQATKGQGE